jgi:hypothetical protein
VFNEKVIDEECRTEIASFSLTDKEKRGKKLVNYLLAENNVDKYEGFLKIWETKNPDEAGKLRTKIHEVLDNQGLKVPERWAIKAANVLQNNLNLLLLGRRLHPQMFHRKKVRDLSS